MSEEKTKNNSWLQGLLIILLVLAAFAIGSMWTELRTIKSGVKPTEQKEAAVEGIENEEEKTTLTELEWQEVIKTGAGIQGQEGAKIIVVEFTDYQCPFCSRYSKETLPQLKKEYIDTGKVKYILKDLPLDFHQHSVTAAMAVRCAGDQNKYWEMHDKLFDNQTAWAELEKVEASFISYAGVIGLDKNIFSDCLNSGKHKEAVNQDLAVARKFKVNGTPTFFINGKILVGAQPLAAFKQMIDRELK